MRFAWDKETTKLVQLKGGRRPTLENLIKILCIIKWLNCSIIWWMVNTSRTWYLHKRFYSIIVLYMKHVCLNSFVFSHEHHMRQACISVCAARVNDFLHFFFFCEFHFIGSQPDTNNLNKSLHVMDLIMSFSMIEPYFRRLCQIFIRHCKMQAKYINHA